MVKRSVARSAGARGAGGTAVPKSRPSLNGPLIGAAALILIALLWAFWPSSVANVTNLDSSGSNIIAFGDSLTAGYGASGGEDYPSVLSSITGFSIVNAGVSGDTTESALARIEDDVLSNDPRVVIVGLGGNDFLRSVPISSTEGNLRMIVRRIHDSGAMVVLLGFRFPSLNANYEKMYERIANEERCLLVPDLLDGVLSNPALRSDAIHPNAGGYRVMAERVAGPLRKLIRKADASQ